MVRLHCCVLIVALCALSVGVRGDESIEERIAKKLDDLFCLWTCPCSQWVKVFSRDAMWYHPKFVDGLNSSQLMDFCQVNQETRPALFRQDGSMRVTISGHGPSSALYHVMVPYVYGQVENGNNDSLFINSGYEYIQLRVDNDGQLRINLIVEFFNRDSVPFVWPPNN